jgi:hypothetical protein
MSRLTVAAVVLAGSAIAPATAAARQNPWFPLHPGTRWVYEGTEAGHASRDVVRVTARTKVIAGVRCHVVSDRVYTDGRLAERTTDWYATSARGVVRYYGEATAELDRQGRVTTTEGSWQAGRDGARAGVFMPAHPRRGQAFQQEHLAGVAEDHFRVLTRHASITVPFGSFTGRVLKTAEWTPLEPGVHDRKYYVRGIGQVAEATVRGGDERLELVRYRR